MRLARPATLLALLVWPALLAVGCQSFGITEGPPDAGGPDPSLDAAPDAVTPPAGPALYVSPEGVDTQDGKTPTTALRSVRAALALALAKGLVTPEIHVCAGRYEEPGVLTVAVPVVLRGGYNCASFSRLAGYPNARAEVADPSETVFVKTGDDASPATVRFDESSKGSIMEGVTVQAATLAKATTAVAVGPKASVELTDVRFVLGSGEGEGATGTGLEVIEASVAVRRAHFRGMKGRNTKGTGATLAKLSSPLKSLIADSTFDPGSVSGTEGATHLTVSSALPARGAQVEVANNSFVSGSPSLTAGENPLLHGMSFTGTGVDVHAHDNKIVFTGVSCPGGCVLTGASSAAGANVVFERNLVQIGNVDSQGLVQIRGLSIMLGGIRAENNVFLNPTTVALGSTLKTFGLNADAGSSCATDTHMCADGPPVMLRHNTVHVGPPPPTSASASVGAVILAKRVTLEENLFFGVGPGIGVRVYTARGAQPASAVGNVFATVQFSPEVANFLGPFGEPHTRTFAADWPSPAANNRAVRELSQVLVDPNFADWHSAPTVKLDLPSNAYCSITNHVPNAQTTPKDDFLRRPRTGSTVSAGAFQFQGTSCSSP